MTLPRLRQANPIVEGTLPTFGLQKDWDALCRALEQAQADIDALELAVLQLQARVTALEP